MIQSVAGAIVAGLLAFTVPLHVFGAYAVTLVVLAALRTRSKSPEADGSQPRSRIAVIVVAHDEERVILDSVTSLLSQRYPPDSFAVHVVADNCTDRTADLARSAGARVLERSSEGPSGKSAAVAFGVSAIEAGGAFDAVAVFDADNTADPDFLTRVAERLSGGERVVQGFVDSKNPDASWVAGSSALGFWAIAELAQGPRERLGLSTPLMGTGFAISLEEARRLLTTGGALTDDLDLAARLAARGIRVAYEARARTVDEKPTELRTAVAQRHRWMQGRWAVAGRHVPELLRVAFGSGDSDLGARLRALDVAVQLVAPSLLFTAVGLALLAGSALALAPLARFGAPLSSWSLAVALVYYAVPAAGIARHRPSPRVWLCYLLQPAYLAWSLPLAVSGFVMRRGERWIRTPKGPGGVAIRNRKD
jgi:cellulose synthase/poly-beta-1,6-N-acetylglucosamine synthase-like glycosyltransferase